MICLPELPRYDAETLLSDQLRKLSLVCTCATFLGLLVKFLPTMAREKDVSGHVPVAAGIIGNHPTGEMQGIRCLRKRQAISQAPLQELSHVRTIKGRQCLKPEPIGTNLRAIIPGNRVAPIADACCLEEL